MIHRYSALFIGAALSVASFAQQRTLIDFELGAFLKIARAEQPVDLFLQGNTTLVERAAKAHGAFVKMKMRNWTSVRIPAGRVRELDQEDAITSIEFRFSQARTLNDSMRYKTHIDWVQQGLAPLPQGYDGEGVVVGILDTGIDFKHPDFSDPLTGTRVLHYWDQNFPVENNTPDEFGYGQEWDKTAIDDDDCPATDNDNGGHGTTVAGTAAGNGMATGNCLGAAPKSDLIIVGTDFGAYNWTATVADGVKYVFDHAQELGRPAVVNLSLGDYLGSHDGLDPAALLIDSMIMAAPGRAVVCAAGNSGCFPNYTLRMDVDSDTSFAWIKTNSVNSFIGVPSAYIDFWGDTAQMNDIQYSIGADRVTGGYSYRGRIPFRNVQGTLNTFVNDTIWSPVNGIDTIAIVSTYASLRGGQYHLEIAVIEPDSANYYWRVMMTGSGRADSWCNNGFGQSEIVSTNLPTIAEYPPMANYVLPTLERGIVDSWACSPHVITVANYNNQLIYNACDGTTQDLGGWPSGIGYCSSFGNTRTGLPKPDVAAPGDVTFSAAPLGLIDAFANGSGVFKLHWDCMHVRAGGTSIASPAVTGAAALYFQKCPYATHTELMNAINSTAFGDAITGPLPSLRWGNGRLDAFAALNTTNYSIDITGGGSFCPGDSAEAQGPPAFDSYVWSDGTTDMNAWSQGEDLSLTVTNAAGCAAFSSDTVSFTLLPAPVAIIGVDGLALTSTPGDSYQWYLDGQAIAGATGGTWTAVANGGYTVEVTGANTCSTMSDPVLISTVGIEEQGTGVFSVWPIPAHDVLNVTVPAGAASHYSVLDARGRVLLQGRWKGTGVNSLDIRSLVPGPYVLKTGTDDLTGRQPFVVQ